MRTGRVEGAQVVVFSAAKEGYAPGEWEDGACGGVSGDRGRFIVVDGATESYEARRWVDELTASFMAPGLPGAAGGPDLQRDQLSDWVQRAQDQWRASVPAAADFIEQEKLRRGALATFLGCQLSGLNGPAPRWRAAALGDTVLFHVRDGQLLSHFPPLRPGDFGLAPEGLSTRPARLGRMRDQLLFTGGDLAVGDVLFAATDAFAQWMIAAAERDEKELWPLLATLSHPAVFARLVAEQRLAGAMKDDDVTLLRIRLLASRPSLLAVCR